METLFTESFLETLDSHMSSYYDQWTTRTDYLTFLAFLERSMSANWYKEPGLAYFEHNRLRNVFGKKQVNKVRKWKLDKIISRLMERNVIIRTDYDKKRGKTRRYGYHIGFNFGQKQAVFGLKSEKTDQKMVNFITQSVDLADYDVSAQYELLTSNRFQIDVSAALNWVDAHHQDMGTIDINQKMMYTRTILDLNSKRIFVVKGKKSGRIFSNYNTIKKELRSFCSIDGEPLKNTDLKSSQPLFLAALLYNIFPCKESNEFYRLVTQGDVYAWFLEKANNKGVYSYNVFDQERHQLINYGLRTRDDSKIAFLRFIFSTSTRGQRPVYETIFKKQFPFLFTKISHYPNLALELQRLESSVFIPVATEFSSKGCLSIHDGLSFKHILESEIIDSLQNRFSELSIPDYTLT